MVDKTAAEPKRCVGLADNAAIERVAMELAVINRFIIIDQMISNNKMLSNMILANLVE